MTDKSEAFDPAALTARMLEILAAEFLPEMREEAEESLRKLNERYFKSDLSVEAQLFLEVVLLRAELAQIKGGMRVMAEQIQQLHKDL